MLTPRQMQVAELVAEGHTTKAIAKLLECSPRTVDMHIARAARRLPGEGAPRHRIVVWWLSRNALAGTAKTP